MVGRRDNEESPDTYLYTLIGLIPGIRLNACKCFLGRQFLSFACGCFASVSARSREHTVQWEVVGTRADVPPWTRKRDKPYSRAMRPDE